MTKFTKRMKRLFAWGTALLLVGGKWFFDVCFNYTTAGDKDFGYTPLDYYFSIPGGEVSKSPVIDQQPNR